jgi:transposase
LTISEERKKRVIDLYYNQGKTTREIAKIERMSIRDISPTLKEEDSKRQRLKDQQQHEDLSAKAYKLFSKGRRPVEVAIALNVREQEVTKLYKEYWRLKRLHRLYYVYTELGDEGLEDFLKLFRLVKKEGVSREQVVNLLRLADETNPFGLTQLEKRHKWRIHEIHELDMQIERSKKHLHSVNNEIASTKALLSSYHISCERKRQESEHLNNEISRLETIISRFKNNNEEYLKIKKTIEEEVRTGLTDGKVLLQFALASII